MLFLCSSASIVDAQYGDVQYYLVDSLVPVEWSESDVKLVDSALTLYHAAEHDTDRINAINLIVEDSWDNNLWPHYNRWVIEFVTSKNTESSDEKLTSFYQNRIADAVGNSGYYYQEMGDLATAAKKYEESIEIYESLNDKSAMAMNLNKLGIVHQAAGTMDEAMSCYKRALVLYEELGEATGKANALNNLGHLNGKLGHLTKSINYYKQSCAINEKTGKKGQIASSYNNLATTYERRGEIEQCISFYEKSLKLYEEMGLKKGEARIYNNLASVYSMQGEKERAVDYYKQALAIREQLNDHRGIAVVHNNLGFMLKESGDGSESIDHYNQSLLGYQKLGRKSGEALVLNNLGYVYLHHEMADKAIEYYRKSLAIYNMIGENGGIAKSNVNLGYAFFRKGEVSKAAKLGETGFKIAMEIGNPELTRNASNLMYEVYKSQGRFSKAIEMQDLYYTMRDSINNQATQKAALAQNIQHSFDKQAAIDSIETANILSVKDAEMAVQEAEIDVKKQQQYVLFLGLFVLVVIAGFVYNRLQITKKQKQQIDEKNLALEEAHQQLAQHHKEIQDSIAYAKRIQEAIMPSIGAMKEALGDSFVFYKPKDVVAGDFFWLEPYGGSAEEHRLYIAAADCTGHGVPGAMVSVVCSNALSKALLEEGNQDTGKLLDRTREVVIEKFDKSGGKVNDGMDISICALDPKTRKLQWSGANNPLLIVKADGELREIKANKQPIGNYFKTVPFTAHDVQLEPGDSIYLFTDGFQDQFGGPKGKKFKVKQFKELLIENRALPMNEQYETLRVAFTDWKRELEQVDDVCVIGIRV